MRLGSADSLADPPAHQRRVSSVRRGASGVVLGWRCAEGKPHSGGPAARNVFSGPWGVGLAWSHPTRILPNGIGTRRFPIPFPVPRSRQGFLDSAKPGTGKVGLFDPFWLIVSPSGVGGAQTRRRLVSGVSRGDGGLCRSQFRLQPGDKAGDDLLESIRRYCRTWRSGAVACFRGNWDGPRQ